MRKRKRLPFSFLFCFFQSVFWFAEFLLSRCLFGNSLNYSSADMEWIELNSNTLDLFYRIILVSRKLHSCSSIAQFDDHWPRHKHFWNIFIERGRLLHALLLIWHYRKQTFFSLNIIPLQVHCILSIIEIWMEYKILSTTSMNELTLMGMGAHCTFIDAHACESWNFFLKIFQNSNKFLAIFDKIIAGFRYFNYSG